MTKIPLETKTDVVPIINVSLVIVLTLMIISPFLDNSETPVDLPFANAHTAEDSDKVEITYTLDGEIYVSGEQLMMSDLQPILGELFIAQPEAIAVIKADKKILYGDVEKLIAAVEAAGAPDIAIATKNETGSGE